MTTPQKPGEKPQQPGPYIEIKPGSPPNEVKPVNPPNEIKMPPGHKPLPPTKTPGDKWVPKK